MTRRGIFKLQVHFDDVLRRVNLAPEGDAFAVSLGARMLAQLQVHHIDVLRQGALRPEGDAGAVAARVVADLLVDGAAALQTLQCRRMTAALTKQLL